MGLKGRAELVAFPRRWGCPPGMPQTNQCWLYWVVAPVLLTCRLESSHVHGDMEPYSKEAVPRTLWTRKPETCSPAGQTKEFLEARGTKQNVGE